jgi:thioredoxin 1
MNLLSLKRYIAHIVLGICIILNSSCIQKPTAQPPINDPVDSTGESFVKQITTINFDSLIVDSGIIAIVEFYSTHCPTCMSISTIIDSLAASFLDTVVVGKSDTDKDTLYKRHSISSIPTFVIYKDGQEITRSSYISTDTAIFAELCSIVNQIRGTTHVPKDTIPEGVMLLEKFNFSSFVDIENRISMVDFYSPLCPACVNMEGIVATIAESYKGRDLIGKVNLNTDDSLRFEYDIYWYPTFVFFKSGVPLDIVEGMATYEMLAEKLDSLLEL